MNLCFNLFLCHKKICMKEIAQYVRTFYTHEAKRRAYIYNIYAYKDIDFYIHI